jgi:ubiquinone/menaquinone biosynthesis C-methylase UbiE
MGLRGRFFAATYNSFMKGAEEAGLTDIRAGLLARAAGRVLEIGGGTGANLAHYGPAVESLTITEPEIPMLKRLERRVRAEAPQTMVLRAPAEDLPFEDDTFDVVVSTLVLCGVDDQPRALREIRRVLRPEGSLLFFEHVRSEDPKAAKKQDRMNWVNQLVVCCNCNRPTLETIRGAGFAVTALEHTTMPKAPSFVRPAIVGTATSPASTASSDTQDNTAHSFTADQ